jgi:hypothetical protein
MSDAEPRDAVVIAPRRSPAPALLERFVTVLSAVRRGVVGFSAAGGLAAALITYALLRHGWPGGAAREVLTVLALALLITPPLVLMVFWQIVGDVASLPERIRRLPLTGREHAEHLGQIVRDARGRGRSAWFHAPLLTWRLTRLTASSRDALTPYAPVLPLLSVPFLALVAAAVAGVMLEVAIAVVVAIVLLVT